MTTMKRRRHPAIWFLGLIVLGVLAVLSFNIWLASNPLQALQLAFVPSHTFAEDEAKPAPDYSADAAWALLPANAADIPLPPGISAHKTDGVDIFYVHPTTSLSPKHWNAAFDDPDASARLQDFVVKNQASAYAAAGSIYMPRYRQAGFGAFFDTSGSGVQAIFKAYGDVVAAFDYYMAHHNNGRPFILAAHSQGTLHSLMLLRDKIGAGSKAREQMVAAYLIGWPISLEADIAPLGLEPCKAANDTGCVISYQSFDADGDPSFLIGAFNALPGVTGQPHAGTHMLCTNPITWEQNGSADAAANKGSLPRKQNAPLEALSVGTIGAHCGDDGILYLNAPAPAAYQDLKMAGSNLHPYDVNLFWGNIFENAHVRAHTFLEHAGGHH